MRLHHVQVACPRGGEEGARRFYGEGLGLQEVPKPAQLAGRGGCWFRAFDAAGAVTAELHVGVEDPFTPARKAHPALLLQAGPDGAPPPTVDELAARLQGLGFDVDLAERATFPGHERFHALDAAGNRVEVLRAWERPAR